MTLLLMSSCTSVDGVPILCSGGHGFDSCWGLNAKLVNIQEQFVEFGGTLKDGEGAAVVNPGSLVTIKTAKNLFTASKVIIAAGNNY